MKADTFRRLINLYPPQISASIKCNTIAEDFTHAAVVLRERPWNMNLVGTHFGGSLFSMCDPWQMILLRQQLGPKQIVWDQSASIDFKKPGRGTLVASFHLSPTQVAQIKEQADRGLKVLPTFTTRILNADVQVVAQVTKTCQVRSKQHLQKPDIQKQRFQFLQ